MRITKELFGQIAETAYADFAAYQQSQGQELPNYAHLDEAAKQQFDGEVYAWLAKFRARQEWELAEEGGHPLAIAVWNVAARLLGAPDFAQAIRAGVALDPADEAVTSVAKKILTPAAPPEANDANTANLQETVSTNKGTAERKNR